MKLPNQITLSRLFMVIVGILLLALHPDGEPGESSLTWVVFTLFLIGAVTDFVDGYVARARGLTSRFGRLLDPFVDKIMIAGALIMLAGMPNLRPMLPSWMVVVMVTREFLVTGLRGMVEASGKTFGADMLGKWKMVVQCVAVQSLLAFEGGWLWVKPIAVGSVWLAVLITVASGANYLRKAWHVLEF